MKGMKTSAEPREKYLLYLCMVLGPPGVSLVDSVVGASVSTDPKSSWFVILKLNRTC